MYEQSATHADSTDNGDIESKIAVRRQALAWAPSSPAILETNAGEGHLYRAVWSATAGRHLGIDKRFVRPEGDPAGECWRGDNRHLLRRAISLGPWDVVDVDTYANPWPVLQLLLTFVPPRPLVVTATCAIERPMQTNGSDFACAVAGIPPRLARSMHKSAAPFSRWYDDVIRWAIAWAQNRAHVRAVECRRVHADTTVVRRSRTRYYVIRYEPRP
jgi:hypothetical protein